MTLTLATKGARPSMPEAIKAKCFDCTAQFFDGRRDCEINGCPLHPRMPYRDRPSNLDWLWGVWSEKHRGQLAKLGVTAQEYIKNVLIVGHTAKGLPKYKIPMGDMIRAKCFRCCYDYSQETVTLFPLRTVSYRNKNNKKVTRRLEKAEGPFATIKSVKHKIIISSGGEAGRIECSIRDCPLYYWTPYRRQLPSYDWMFESDHTKKHRLAVAALGISEEEYVQRLLVEKSL